MSPSPTAMKPPHVRKQPARFGPRCHDCMNYEADLCLKYAATVDPNDECDDWQRNPDLPIKAV